MSLLESKYTELCNLARQSWYLSSTMALLEWDQQTKLPSLGGAYRTEQVTFLAEEIHKRETDPRRGELLDELNRSEMMSEPFSDHGANIRELKRTYDKKKKLPTELVSALANATSIGQQVWVEARKENNFTQFAPHLKEIFRLKREEADAIGFDGCRYDVLLDDYEPGAKTSEVKQVLDRLKDELVPLVAEIGESRHQPDAEIVRRHFPESAQRTIGKEASSRIGFDYERGRLDVTHHPFCTEIGPHDVRITTRYDESFFNSSFFGILHEAGHGIYEQGLASEHYGLPIGQYCSLGIHESQSRLWENLVGRSASFWTFYFPRAKELFKDALGDVSQSQFVAAINQVSPSLIRVEADEATYNLHIIIRFQLEQAVINGDLETDQLPDAWNEMYQEYLGVTPDSDANGVLQDIHWSAGLVGYFSTYSLGNLYASQMYEAAEQELGSFDEMFQHGEFTPLKKWLNDRVHIHGRRYSSPNLGKKVTGKDLSHEALIRHLRRKLSPIYAL